MLTLEQAYWVGKVLVQVNVDGLPLLETAFGGADDPFAVRFTFGQRFGDSKNVILYLPRDFQMPELPPSLRKEPHDRDRDTVHP